MHRALGTAGSTRSGSPRVAESWAVGKDVIFADFLGKAVGAVYFFLKTNLKLYADGLESDRRQRGFENPSVHNGYFFPLTASRGLSVETLPRVWTSGSRQRSLAEEKLSGSTVPSGAVGKSFADGFYVFADRFGRSTKDLFPVVDAESI
jgi:hypothetical protein